MTVKSLTAGVLAGALTAGLCVSCGQNDPSAATGGQSRGGGKTLAGAADTSKAAKSSQQQAEVRLPEAVPTRQPAAASPAGPSPTVPARIATDLPPAPAPQGPADVSDVPPAPKDAQWTLFCTSITGPDHVAIARDLKSKLIKQTNMREWYIVHESSQSRMYYGYYRSIADKGDAAETERAQADRKKIDALTVANGQRPFSACQFVQLAAPDPESPPQWNIVNTPQDKVWTLIIGAYKDHPDRKKAAVEAVRDARATGEEAYYYHGENVSNVLIGTWTDDAVAEEKVDEKNGANKFRDPLFVLPNGVQAPQNMRDKDGKAVRVVGQRLVAVDPTLQAKMKQYPNIGLNGEFVLVKQNGKAVMEPTRVVAIPRPAQSIFQDAPAEPGAEFANDPRGGRAVVDDAYARPANDAGSGASGNGQRPANSSGNGNGGNTGGRLRSIGD